MELRDTGHPSHRFCNSEGLVTSGRTRGMKCTGKLTLSGVEFACSNPIHDGVLGSPHMKGTIPDGESIPKIY